MSRKQRLTIATWLKLGITEIVATTIGYSRLILQTVAPLCQGTVAEQQLGKVECAVNSAKETCRETRNTGDSKVQATSTAAAELKRTSNTVGITAIN